MSNTTNDPMYNDYLKVIEDTKRRISSVREYLSQPIDYWRKRINTKYDFAKYYEDLCNKSLQDIYSIVMKVIETAPRHKNFMPIEPLIQFRDELVKLCAKTHEITHALQIEIQRRKDAEREYKIQKYLSKELEDKRRLEQSKREAQLLEKKLEEEAKERERYLSEDLPIILSYFEKADRYLQSITLDANQDLNTLESLRKGISGYYDRLVDFNKKIQQVVKDEDTSKMCQRIADQFSAARLKVMELKHQINNPTRPKVKRVERKTQPLFAKMEPIIGNNNTAYWWEDDNRIFMLSEHEDLNQYMEAYAIAIGSTAEDIVYVGEEDTDKWGYIKKNTKCLPFCLRKINTSGHYPKYHLYTFQMEGMRNIENYNYDDVITDRIFYLKNRGLE